METPLKHFLRIFVETLHAWAMGHHLHSLHNLSLVFSNKLDCKEEKQLEMEEDIRIDPIHKLQIIFCELERRFFEGHISWRAAKDKTEIDMNDMPMVIN
jgi:hypothetical protein